MTEAEFRALRPGDKIRWVTDNDSANDRTVRESVNHKGLVRLDDGWAKDWSCWDWVSVANQRAAASHIVAVVPGEPVPRLVPVSGYESLSAVLDEALAQAQAGKGKERHANGEPYDAQKIVTLNLQIGSEHGAIFQGCKKAQESARLEAERGDAELLGAINYLAAAVIIRRKLRAKAGK